MSKTLFAFACIFTMLGLSACASDDRVLLSEGNDQATARTEVNTAATLRTPVNDAEPYRTEGADTGAYRVSSGDQVRVIIFNQPTLSNVYGVDSSGNLSLPLVGVVKADGKTTRQLERAIAGRLAEQDLVTEAKVAVEVAVYRPFAILGEVRTPGRFPYSPGMTVESAVALAGGYTIHANQERVRVTRRVGGEAHTFYASPVSTFQPGDTLYVTERWF